MAAGGYQQPSNPAPVSGPGAMSKRTDSGPAQKLTELPDAQYGEAATYRDLQQSAPLSQTPSPNRPKGASLGGGAGPSTPFGAPTQMPDQPVTAGVGAQQNDFKAISPEDADRLRRYLPAMIEMATRPDATEAFRNYVRQVRAAVR